MDVNCLYSIIVPVYNTPIAYLDKCLSSLLNQTFKGIEIIMVDDGSGYETSEMCNKYAEKDSRVKVIHQKNQGVSAARNTGINSALGEWIMFVDADDWLELDTCEQLKEKLNEKQCEILMFNHVRDYSGKTTSMKYGLISNKLYTLGNIDDKELLYKRAMGAPDAAKGWSCTITYVWDKVYSKKWLLENNLKFPVGIPKSEDKLFVLSCLRKASYLLYFEKAFYHYRMNDASICNRYSEDADLHRKKLVDRLGVIAGEMDEELRRIKGIADYHEIRDEYFRFVFGTISDVLLLKFFHKDNPQGISVRRNEALAFISAEPFRSSIDKVNYSKLSKDAKIKKFLLEHHLVITFCIVKNSLNIAKGNRVSTG